MFKNIINRKKAFTLGEVMVVMTIIGIVASATIKITISQTNYAKKFLYYATYMNLKSAAGEIIANGSTDTGTFKKSLPVTWNINTTTVQQMGLCQRLTELFNTIGAPTCGNTTDGNSFTDANLSFTIANGARVFYQTYNSGNYTIYVDINGLKGKSVKNEDIMPFIVNAAAGSVIPDSNSKAYDNTDYLSASVKYTDSVSGTTYKVSNGVTFEEAQCNANLITSPCGSYQVKKSPCGNSGVTCFVEINKPGF